MYDAENVQFNFSRLRRHLDTEWVYNLESVGISLTFVCQRQQRGWYGIFWQAIYACRFLASLGVPDITDIYYCLLQDLESFLKNPNHYS